MFISLLIRLWRWVCSFFFLEPQLPPPPEPPGDEADLFLLPDATEPLLLPTESERPAARNILYIGGNAIFKTETDVRL